MLKSKFFYYLFINTELVSQTNLQPELTLPCHENIELSDVLRLIDID